MSGKTWLTFMNSSSLSEKAIRGEFAEFGQVTECDGEVGSVGWVMVALKTKSQAQAALDTLTSREGGGVGETLRFLRGHGEDDEMMATEEENSDSSRFPKPVPADKAGDIVSLKTKVVENGGSPHGLMKKDLKDVALGGLTHFNKVNHKILEMVSLNNTLLLERVREVEERRAREVGEKEEQIKRLTNRLAASAEFEEKAKKFFGENEDFHKKKMEDLTKANKELKDKLSESEARRMENLLEEADSTKIRETVTSLAGITEDIQSKTEQVWAVVQGMDTGLLPGPDGSQSRDVQPASSTMGLLHNKVDKMIRLMVETSENQKKMNKVLQDLLKSGLNKSESVPVAAPEDKERDRDKDREGEREDRDGRKRKRRERERSREREESFGRDKRSKSPDPGLDSISAGPHQIDTEYEELKWGLNMALIGDGHWKSFNMVEDIHKITGRMEHKVNFRVMGKEGETLSRMYDEQRECLISPLPTRCYKVAISIGTYDLKDNSLITLKEASMEEVRRRNEAKLVAKAQLLRDLVIRLNNQNKSVVVMIPPHGEERLELHHHWEEIVLSTLKDIKFPKIRILNMGQVMRSTISEFRNNDDYLERWLAPTPKPRRYLSPYGTRRMFYALRQTVTAKTAQAAGMGAWPEVGSHANSDSGYKAALIPNPAEWPCPRCTRHHPGTPDTCKSLDKMCRRCGNVGHFTEVHDVTDPHYRQLIVSTLGINLWGDWEAEEGEKNQLEKISEMERRMGLERRGSKKY